MLWYWIVAAALLAPNDRAGAYPRPLGAVLDADRPTTSQIEWKVTWLDAFNEGLVERYVTRTAGASVWESNLGDENGFHHARFTVGDGGSVFLPGVGLSREDFAQADFEEVSKARYSGTLNRLVDAGTAWYLNADKPISGDAAPVGHALAKPPVDVGSLGLYVKWEHARPHEPFGLDGWLAQEFSAAAFSQGTENGRTVVEAHFGEHRLKWTLDDEKGGSPVRTEFYSADRLLFYSESEPQNVGGRWLPRSVEFYLGDRDVPYKTIEVGGATYTQPWHMQEITPDMVGAVIGTHFTTPDGEVNWDGNGLVDNFEFWEMVYLDGLLPDRPILEFQANERGESLEERMESLRRFSERVRDDYFRKHGTRPWLEAVGPKGKEKDEWDLYVEKFLAEQKLPDAAVSRAKEILKQSKQLRDVYRRKDAPRIREAQEEGNKEKLARLREREKDIFERVLVRSLKKLVPSEPVKGPVTSEASSPSPD